MEESANVGIAEEVLARAFRSDSRERIEASQCQAETGIHKEPFQVDG
jgi:hypothetical protein